MIPLGKRERGVYLVEAVAGDLRAYTVVVVTDLAMVEKASPNGEIAGLCSRSQERRNHNQTRELRSLKQSTTVASGKTNGEGLFRTRIQRQEEGADDLVERTNE